MKQIYGIVGIAGVLLLLIGAASTYAYTSNAGFGMMGNYQGNSRGMMNNIDQQKRDKMNTAHEQMIKNLDSETAKQVDAMHDSYMGNNDGDAQ